MRYVPILAGKRLFWNRVMDTYFAWHPYKFSATTVFGSKMVGNTRDILQQYIYYFGVWEPNLTSFIRRRIAPGDTFIDVGANIGYFSLLAANLVGKSGRAVAIEPSPKLFAALCHNLARNHMQNVRAVNVAVSDRKGVSKLFKGTEYHSGLTTTIEKRGLKFECEIEAAPLNAILYPEEMQKARFIKIDVEGAEWAAVVGMGQILCSGRTDLEIMVEVDPKLLANQGKRPEDLVKIFSDAGFYPYSLENDYSAGSVCWVSSFLYICELLLIGLIMVPEIIRVTGSQIVPCWGYHWEDRFSLKYALPK
jgi:FkbM family methyltransferase